MEIVTFYAGCNYYVDHDSGILLGTAISMHNCNRCKHIDICEVKRLTETWEFNEEIEQEITLAIKKLREHLNKPVSIRRLT